MTLNVLDIIKGTTVDGPGFRTAIYLAGCNHDCHGCHNPESHDPCNGSPMSIEQILEIVCDEDFDVTLTGGDPLFNVDESCALAMAVKDYGYNIWLYTGYTWEQIVSSETLSKILKYTDFVVDGPYIESLKNPDLLFRGSSNQRIIDVRESKRQDKVVEYNFN